MDEVVEKSKCCGCYACVNACPNQAIMMQSDKNGFEYPEIIKEKCINCGICKQICPVLNNKEQLKRDISFYACYNKNIGERMNSSSGGIFVLLAKEIIRRNGVVFGAGFDAHFQVKHFSVDNENAIQLLMGSKYVQSKIGETYREVKELLDNGKFVLFTGTPCQIEGLLSYLRKDYDRLYTQDIICHGVPSPKVWNKYLEYRKNKDGQEPKKISFRNKESGWINSNILFQYEGKKYTTNCYDDEYMKAFLKNSSLRDSCYQCSFKKKYRESDITLADFWGIQEIDKSMYDNRGTSLVVVNSEKGRELFELIKDDMIYKKMDDTLAFTYNPSYMKSVSADKNRETFFNKIDKTPFDKLVKKYTDKVSSKQKVFRNMKNIIKKFIQNCSL